MGSDYSHVFSPITIRGIDFKNRITLAPPSPNLASSSGLITPEFVDWFRMFARGGVTTLYVGNCSVDITECKDEAYQLDMANELGILEMTRYADMCKQYDCHASFEINHNGENTAFETVGHAPFSSSPNISASERTRAAQLGREPIPAIEMTHEKIRETVEKYGKAAGMMKRAGMDICLIHGGHGNLISQFTSPLYNHRTDEYGGSLENRARFAIEVCQSVRKHAGEDFVIEFRISADEIAEEGMHFDETLELIGLLKPYIDIIHVSAGLHSDFNMKYFRNWCQNYMMDRCFNVHYARKVKERYPDLLVNTVGSIVSIDYAEEIIKNGWADFVAMCRPLMADPEMPRKYAENRPEDRRPCLRCDTCTKHLMVPKPIYCAVNPYSGMTTDLKDGLIPKAPVKKKVAVVGGGPAGITALQTLCERGHDVTLYEMQDHLGGYVYEAALPPFKVDMKDYYAWLVRQAEKCEKEYGARILMNTRCTKEMLEAEGYEAVIIALGSDPMVPESIPGIHKPHVHWAPDAEKDHSLLGKKIVIVGGGSVGLESAWEFTQMGLSVEVIEMAEGREAAMKLRQSAGSAAREFTDMIDAGKLNVHYGTALQEITDSSVICRNAAGETVTYECDTVLLAMGMKARSEEAQTMRHVCAETSVFVVGDAKKVGNIGTAVNEAFRICLHI